jgi:hypothetical protein
MMHQAVEDPEIYCAVCNMRKLSFARVLLVTAARDCIQSRAVCTITEQ